MPIKQSAIKALRQTKKHAARNAQYRRKMESLVHKFKKAVVKSKDEAKALVPQIQKAIDKAAKHGVIKMNTASRIKSRLSSKLK